MVFFFLIFLMVIVLLGLGLLVLRYIEDVLKWLAPRQRHPLEWEAQGDEDTQRGAGKKLYKP